MEGGGALAALEAMKAHPKEVGVQVGTEEVGEAEARHAGEGPIGGPPSPCPHSHHGPSLVDSFPSSYSSVATYHPPEYIVPAPLFCVDLSL